MSRALPPGLPDGADRLKAATIFDRNLVVTAGAGTGKTALLVERLLNLIGSGRTTIRSVAAITFTEKAAAELRQRVAAGLDALQRLAASGAPAAEPGLLRTEAGRSWRWLTEAGGATAAEIRGRARAALTDLDAASISTIHSFCADILRRFPDAAGVDPSFVPEEGQAFRLLFEEEWESFLLEETGARPPREETWRRALTIPGALDDIRIVARELAMLGLDEGAPPVMDGSSAGAGLMGRAAASVSRRLFGVIARSSGANPRFKDYVAGAAQLLADFEKGGGEKMAATATPMSLDAFLDFGATPAPGAKIAGVDPLEAKAAAEEARRLVKLLSRIDEERIGRIVETAAPLAARARRRYLAAGYVSFDALLQIARGLLAGHPGIRRYLGARYATILVDEFQDTDPLQYEILFHLTAEGEGPADAWASRPAPGRLFIVGDPKQSIYRFRGADMEAYRRAVARVLDCGGEELTLTASFRSPEEIVGPINTLFEALMRPEPDEEPSVEAEYRPIASARGPAGGGARVEIWSIVSEGRAAEGRRGEAEAIARWIASGRGREAATGSSLRCKDVALLLRALTNAGVYAHALRRAGIPYVVEGGRGFYERPEVSDLISLLRAALNPLDGAAVLAVMRSPAGGVSDVELARFAAAGGRLDGSGDPGGGRAAFEGVDRTLRMLESLREETRALGVAATLEVALHRTNLMALHASAFEGAQRVANLEKIASRAAEIARRGLSLERTLDLIESEYREEAAHGEAPLADETVDAVRILSVHKAKGLEYPVVIVPDLGRRAPREGGGDAGASLVRADSSTRLAVRLSGGQINSAEAWRELSAGWHAAAEEKRVFYVACTRAVSRLVLVNSHAGRAAAPWRDALAALGYEAAEGIPAPGALDGGRVVHHVVEAAPPEAATVLATAERAWEGAAKVFEEEARGIEASVAPPVRSPSGAGDARVAAGPGENDPAMPLRGRPAGVPEAPRLAGSAVHLALERWDFRDGAALVDLARAAVVQVLVPEGHPWGAGTDQGQDREAAGAGLPKDRREGAEGRDRRGPDRALTPERRGGAEAGLAGAVTAEVEAILSGFLASSLPAEIGARAAVAPGLLREVPVIVRAPRDDGAEVWVGAADLITRDDDGTWVVADYKTGRVTGNPAAEADRHREQLAVYTRALREALGTEMVRAEIIFVREGIRVPVQI